MTVTYVTMNDRLLEVIPALRSRYTLYDMEWRTIEDPDDPDAPIGPHIAYGDFLNPHIMTLLHDGNRDGELVSIFAFVEELAQHTDAAVVNVIDVTVVEGLIGSLRGDVLQRAVGLMGPVTRKLAYEREEMFRHCDEIRRMLRTVENTGA